MSSLKDNLKNMSDDQLNEILDATAKMEGDAHKLARAAVLEILKERNS